MRAAAASSRSSSALKSQIESIGGFGKLPDVINALGSNVLTDLTIGDAESLYGLVNGVNPASIEHISIDDTNFLYDCGYPTRCGSYYLYANDQSFKSLSHFVQDIFPPPDGARRGRPGHVRQCAAGATTTRPRAGHR